MLLTKEEKLRKLLEVANEDYVSMEQAKNLFRGLIDSIERLKKQITQEADARKTELDTTINSLAAHVFSSIETELNDKVRGIKVDTTKYADEVRENIINGLEKFKQEILVKIPPKTDLSEIYTQIDDINTQVNTLRVKLGQLVIPKPNEIEDVIYKNLPKYGDKFRDALELLQGDERLDKSAIKGLIEEFDTIKKQIVSSKGGGARRVFQPYLDDFSAETDGSTKIFYLSREPLKTNTATVFGTDFPSILRPTIDFTITGKVLTLTDAVPAPNQGATLLCSYFA